MNVLILQHGDFAEAWRRFADEGAETYRDQRASVEFVADLAPDFSVTTVALCGRTHDVELAPGLRSIGFSEAALDDRQSAALFDELAPDRFLCRTPHWRALREARRRRVATLPWFADTFALDGPRAAFRNLRLRLVLTGSHAPCVANHSLNASRSVAAALRYPAARIVPWDREPVPAHPNPKPGVSDPAAPRLFFAGLLTENKGVGDCLRAVARLRARGLAASIDFAGGGDAAPWRAEAERLGLAEAARFSGSLPNDEVLTRMREADIVVVPTRRSYAEGLPNTLREALAARSAVVISDHPAFSGRLRPERDCLVFRGGDAGSLADRVAHLCEDRALYARLSENGPEALRGLVFGMPWRRLVELFLDDPADRTGWVAANSLETLLARPAGEKKGAA